MFRFFVDSKEGDKFKLSQETLNHIKVARVTKEKFICIFDEQFFVCKLEDNFAKIIDKLELNHEYDGDLILAAAIIDFKKMDILIQKAAELGVKKFIPVITKNVSQKIYGDSSKRLERWNKISLHACEQSFRNKRMIVEDITKLEDVLKIDVKNKYIAHEKDESGIEEFFPTNSLFLIGPEGGFTEEEVSKANLNNFKTISLGKRILRAETASIFVLSKVIE